MINRFIQDIRKALDANCYFAALSLALTLPDICGNPKENVGDRYRRWYDENIGNYDKPTDGSAGEPDMPHLTGEVVYKLRCSLLHRGTSDLDLKTVEEDANKIDCFRLICEGKNQFDLYCDGATVRSDALPSEHRIEYEANIRRLCLIICHAAENYYKKHKDEFDFSRIAIIEQESLDS